MAKFGKRSRDMLATVHHRLVKVAYIAIVRGPDFAVISGYRSPEEQEELFKAGRSQLRGGHSKHNRLPSEAFDVAPWPVLWGDPNQPATIDESIRLFNILGPYILGVADGCGVRLVWGGDWDHDWQTVDQQFHDLGHFELAEH